MGKSLETVLQTHKAILFEEFNGWQPATLNLATILDGIYQDIDDMAEKIERLEVHSFKEFLEKFAPKIYETVDQVGADYIVSYTMDVKEGGVPIPITEHVYYRMLNEMYGKKAESGLSNREFDDSKLREILTPQSEENEMLRLRKKAMLLIMQYTEAVNKKENANLYAKQMVALREEVAQKALRSSMTRLSLNINAINNQIKFLDSKLEDFKALPAGSENSEIKRGTLDYDENGNPVIKELLSAENSTASDAGKFLTAGESTRLLKGAVEKTIDARGVENGMEISPFTKQMVISTYLPADDSESFSLMPAEIIQKKTELEAKRDKLEKIYLQAQTAFMKVLKQIVQRIMGVKVFFDHATIKGGDEGTLPKGQGLLVTNCPVSDLLVEGIKQKFKKFIIDRGITQSKNAKLWFGILPHVIVGEINPEEQTDDSAELDPFKINVDSEQNFKSATRPVTTLNEAKEILSILNEGRILTFFNPATAQDAPFTFGGITSKTIDEIKSELNEIGIDFEHAVFAYPNFTLVRDIRIPIDKREDSKLLDVSAVYVDAAYVAAGIVAASQQPEYLVKHGFNGKVDRQSVCVRLDIEEEELSNKILTKFNRELSHAWAKDIFESISRDNFGFVFSGDSKFDSQRRQFLENSYVLLARTMKKNKDGIYQPIYKTLTNDFILAYLRAQKIDKKPLLRTFLSTDVGAWKNDSTRGEKIGIINVILRKGEDVTQSKNNPNELCVTLEDGESFIEVEITNQ